MSDQSRSRSACSGSQDAGLRAVWPPAARRISAADARFGPAAQAVRDWLLKLEAQRYAPATPDSLSTLRTEFRRLAWPSANPAKG